MLRVKPCHSEMLTVALFPQAAWGQARLGLLPTSAQARLGLLPTRKRRLLAWRPTRLSCIGAQPQELGYRLCSQNLRLSSRIAFGSDHDCQMTWPGQAGARTWTQFWAFAWATSQREVKVLSAPKSANNLCAVRILFSSVESAEIEDSCESIPTLILQTDSERSCGRYDGGGTRTASRRGLSGGFGRSLGPGVLIVSVADFFRFHSKYPSNYYDVGAGQRRDSSFAPKKTIFSGSSGQRRRTWLRRHGVTTF